MKHIHLIYDPAAPAHVDNPLEYARSLITAQETAGYHTSCPELYAAARQLHAQHEVQRLVLRWPADRTKVPIGLASVTNRERKGLPPKQKRKKLRPRKILTLPWKQANKLLNEGTGEFIEITVPPNSYWDTPTTWRVRRHSARYTLFRSNRTCVQCGRTGTNMVLTAVHHHGKWTAHFNLHDDEGRLMTKDHIIPKSKGGPNSQSNYQTMCCKCNSRKSDKL